MSLRADFDEQNGEGGRTLVFSGSLSISQIGNLSRRLRDTDDIAALDISNIEHLDTVGAWLLVRTARDSDAEIIGCDDDQRQLIEEVRRSDEPVELERDHGPPFRAMLAEVGEATIAGFSSFIGLIAFFGSTVLATGRVLMHPRRIRWNAIIQRFDVVGVRALAIVGLMSFLIGVVIAQQGAVQLRAFGAEIFTINLVGRLTLRELGVLMTAIMVAGRSGSAFAAQIGTMKLTEEIDAMRTIGVSPMEALVLPRVLATVLMMPLLTVYASIIAIVGGGLLCWIGLDIPPATFVSRLREVTPITDLWIALIKAPVFGAIVAIAGCYQGLQVENDAEQVGLKTTAAVVQAIFMVIVLDAFFAVFFSALGWV
ncbi:MULTISPECIES: MlaE family ABC transporter permease [Novosphingopyxis]|uniref:MlaE family ABC transporter permease n=1 Tax=Novosphingopyxis TaxID=2709686 RepID=UPI001651AE05|nr:MULTISPECIES: ABC transporter permease [Novosphingopyxis]MBH9536384.1 ABC transporter permease [Novosphingopyxis sp. YJ-S2-01]